MKENHVKKEIEIYKTNRKKRKRQLKKKTKKNENRKGGNHLVCIF